MIITAREIRKTYRSSSVLEDVSFDLGAGQCLAVLGPNGAGKTTLLRILSTLLRPTGGTLSVAGVNALEHADAVRAAIGVVAHGSYVYEDLSAVENLRFWATLGGSDASDGRLRRALQDLELDAVADERVRTFSAGMKRRLALARIVLSDPKLLLLDEPFTALDQRGRKWLGEFLLAFKARGGAAVVATHSFAGALAVADRVAILAGGRLVLDQPRADLSTDALRHLYDRLTEGEDGEALA